MGTKSQVFRIDAKKAKVSVTGYSSVEEAMKNGNSPVFASAAEVEKGMSLAHINKAIHQLSGKPDTKPYEDPAKASKALWPLLKKKSIAGAKAPGKTEAKTAKKPRVAGTGGNRGKIMTPTVKENPYRPKSKSFDAFQMVLDNPGKTMQHYIDKGARTNTLAGAVRDNHVKLTDPK